MICKKILILLIIINLSLLMFCLSPVFSQDAQDVFINIGNGDGSPGSSNREVEISLTNHNNKVKGMQLQICDEGNHLACTGCEVIGRASELDCSVYENSETGYVNVVLFSLGALIEEGEGPVALLNFDVSIDAPSGECVSLNANLGDVPEIGRSAEAVSDENNMPLSVSTEPGEFCFTSGCIASLILGDDSQDSSLLRDFKEKVLLRSETGKELVSLYYQHASELVSITMEHQGIHEYLKKVLIGMLPAMKQIVDDGNVTINRYKTEEISRLCNMLSEKAGRELQKSIAKFQDDFNKGKMLQQLNTGIE